MQGTIQKYTLDMADGTALKPLIVKQGDTNSRFARISLVAFKEPWTIPFGCQIHINVHKNDGTYANATCTQEDEHTVLAPITEQMTAVPGTQLGELFFLGADGDIRSQTFPLVVWDAVSDLDRMVSSDDFQALKEALRDVKVSSEAADTAAQYATEQGNQARDGARRANDAADSIQAAVNAAAAAKVSETNSKASETAAAQTQQEVTDYVEAQKAAFVGYSKRESDSKYACALTNSITGDGRVTVYDAWTAPVLDMEVAGRSEQVTTTGAQLLPQPQFNETKNGLTIKTQMDGGVAVTGTATTATAFPVAEVLLEPGTYTLSGLSGLPVGKMYLQLLELSAQGQQAIGDALARVGSVASETITIDHNMWVRAEIKVLSKVTANIVCYPMLNTGDTALPYEPYTGGAPSPSPEYPQEIVSTDVTAVTVTGAQLLDTELIQDAIINGIKFSNNHDGSISVTGTSTAIAPTNQIVCDLAPGSYYISGNQGDVNVYARTNKNGAISYYSNQSFVIAEGDEVRVYLQVRSGNTVNTKVRPMLNVGSHAAPWEPYQSKTVAITLTEPLRGIGEYQDGITCRDGVWGVERVINQIDDTGTVPISEALEVLATPTWEPLPDNTQQALNALTTYAGTTHLTITAGGTTPLVTLDYVQDTRKALEQHDAANRQYTDNLIATIVAALPTATQAAIVDNQTTRLLQEV